MGLPGVGPICSRFGTGSFLMAPEGTFCTEACNRSSQRLMRRKVAPRRPGASEAAGQSFGGCFWAPRERFFCYSARINEAWNFDTCMQRFAYSCFARWSGLSLWLLPTRSILQ